MQLGNTDVRFQNQYYLPQFSYGYLIDRTHQKSATLYVSIEPGVNPLDAQLLDCKNDCQPEDCLIYQHAELTAHRPMNVIKMTPIARLLNFS